MQRSVGVRKGMLRFRVCSSARAAERVGGVGRLTGPVGGSSQWPAQVR